MADKTTKKVKTSKADFDLFKQTAMKWIDELGLKNWKIDFYHDKQDKSVRSCILYDLESKLASIYLNEDWTDDQISDGNIKSSAFHEVIHLTNAELEIMARHCFSNNQVSQAAEGIIHRWTNYFERKGEI